MVSPWAFAVGLDVAQGQQWLHQVSLQCLRLAFSRPLPLFWRLIPSCSLRGKGSGLLVHNKRLRSRRCPYLEQVLFERGPARTNLGTRGDTRTGICLLTHGPHAYLTTSPWVGLKSGKQPQEMWWGHGVPCGHVFIVNPLGSEASFPIPFAPSTELLAASTWKRLPLEPVWLFSERLYLTRAQFATWVVGSSSNRGKLQAVQKRSVSWFLLDILQRKGHRCARYQARVQPLRGCHTAGWPWTNPFVPIDCVFLSIKWLNIYIYTYIWLELQIIWTVLISTVQVNEMVSTVWYFG